MVNTTRCGISLRRTCAPPRAASPAATSRPRSGRSTCRGQVLLAPRARRIRQHELTGTARSTAIRMTRPVSTNLTWLRRAIPSKTSEDGAAANPSRFSRSGPARITGLPTEHPVGARSGHEIRAGDEPEPFRTTDLLGSATPEIPPHERRDDGPHQECNDDEDGLPVLHPWSVTGDVPPPQEDKCPCRRAVGRHGQPAN